MNDLAILEAEEQLAFQLLREASRKKQELMQQLDEQAKINAELKRQELATQVAELRPLSVFGASYEQLRKNLRRTSVRFVRVHSDVLDLLKASLPAESEERFCELVSTLVSRLLAHSATYHQLREHIEALKNNTESSKYFDPEHASSVVVISCEGRTHETKHATFADVLTAWALSWGEATRFESN